MTCKDVINLYRRNFQDFEVFKEKIRLPKKFCNKKRWMIFGKRYVIWDVVTNATETNEKTHEEPFQKSYFIHHSHSIYYVAQYSVWCDNFMEACNILGPILQPECWKINEKKFLR